MGGPSNRDRCLLTARKKKKMEISVYCLKELNYCQKPHSVEGKSKLDKAQLFQQPDCSP